MDRIWESNDEKDEETELAYDEHRDRASQPSEEFFEDPEEKPLVDKVAEALEEDGEDVASSPAQRAQEVPEPNQDLPEGVDPEDLEELRSAETPVLPTPEEHPG